MREPLPKEFVIDAWKASVGYSFDNKRTQDAYKTLAQCQDSRFTTLYESLLGMLFAAHREGVNSIQLNDAWPNSIRQARQNGELPAQDLVIGAARMDLIYQSRNRRPSIVLSTKMPEGALT